MPSEGERSKEKKKEKKRKKKVRLGPWAWVWGYLTIESRGEVSSTKIENPMQYHNA